MKKDAITKGKLYGVGVGPGDPELLTIKAVRILREADVIAVPDKGTGDRTAWSIVQAYIVGKPLLPCAAPMIRDQAALDEAHNAVAFSICAQLEEGKTVAYITLGDPSIYSTYMYIHRRVLARGYEAELIAGVPSFCAAAARLNASLCEGSERLLVVPASHKDITDCLSVDANLIFMKAGREIGALKEKLASYGLLESASLVANCGMAEEQVWEKFADVPENTGYFSVVLVKKGA